MVESSPALALVLVQHKSMADDGSALEGRNAERDNETIQYNYYCISIVVNNKGITGVS